MHIAADLAKKWKTKLEEKKELEELLKQAQSGDGEAIFNYGMKYYMSDNNDDDVVAFQWFKKGHRAGNVKCTALMGEMLAEGIGVQQNNTLGVAYMMSVARESNLAAFSIGKFFAQGTKGLRVDVKVACEHLERVVQGTCKHKNLQKSFIAKARDILKELQGRL